MAQTPDCDYDESTSGNVHIRMKIPGIKPHSSSCWEKCTQRGTEAQNAEINKDIGTRHYNLKIIGQSDLRGQNYAFIVRQLPYEIIPAGCTLEVHKDWVHVFLKKKDEHQSWMTFIRNANLNAAE